MRKKNLTTAFAKAFEALPCNMQEQVRNEIAERFNKSIETVKAKKNGRRNLSDREETTLIEIFAKYNVNYLDYK